MTTEQLKEHLEALIEKVRKEDSDARHEKNKAIDRAIESLMVTLSEVRAEVEHGRDQCRESFTNTRNQLESLLSALRGNPDLGQVGLIQEIRKGINDISDRVREVEKVSDEHRRAVDESRQHRTQHADVPARLTALEQKVAEGKTVVRTLAWVFGMLWTGLLALGAWLGWGK